MNIPGFTRQAPRRWDIMWPLSRTWLDFYCALTKTANDGGIQRLQSYPGFLKHQRLKPYECKNTESCFLGGVPLVPSLPHLHLYMNPPLPAIENNLQPSRLPSKLAYNFTVVMMDPSSYWKIYSTGTALTWQASEHHAKKQAFRRWGKVQKPKS